MVSRQQVRETVFNAVHDTDWTRITEVGIDSVTDAIMALLPDAEALGRACRASFAAWKDCVTYEEFGNEIMEALRQEREG